MQADGDQLNDSKAVDILTLLGGNKKQGKDDYNSGGASTMKATLDMRLSGMTESQLKLELINKLKGMKDGGDAK